MKRCLLLGACVMAHLLLPGCRRQEVANAVPPLPAAADATYLIKEETGETVTIRLKKGEQRLPSEVPELPSSGSLFKLSRSFAGSDLNHDAVNDIVGVIEANYGGSATWAHLVVVLSQPAGALPILGIDLGNNTGVEALRVDGDRITVQMLKLGDDDPHCCPTTKVTETYVVSGNQLKNVS